MASGGMLKNGTIIRACNTEKKFNKYIKRNFFIVSIYKKLT